MQTKKINLDKLAYKHRSLRGKKQDDARSALCAGRRRSKAGKIYYEYRVNRSDNYGKTGQKYPQGEDLKTCRVKKHGYSG